MRQHMAGNCAGLSPQLPDSRIDPDAWSIAGTGKLYLNFSKVIRARWAAGKKRPISKLQIVNCRACAGDGWPILMARRRAARVTKLKPGISLRLR